MDRRKSDHPVLPEKKVFGKRMFVFPVEYADANQGEQKGMLISINAIDTFIPCGIPVDLSYDVWMLLKNIGRIAKVVAVIPDETTK